MEKLIFRKFFTDTLSFFLIGTLSLSLIVWVIQAVNYLDFVSEDGHSFKVYFLYTLLNFPKIISRLIIFMFFISVFYTISRYEEKNELLIFWTNGVKKKEFLNFVTKCSFFLLFIQLLLNLFIVPYTQDLARSFIRSSNIDYFPSLLKSKKFVNTAKDLTIFVEKKNDKGELINIFLKDSNKKKGNAQIISAKKGLLKKNNDDYYLILYNGNIVDETKDGVNILSYDKTQFNLSNYSTKTTVDPKIQEQSSSLLIKCAITVFKYNESFQSRNLNCKRENIKEVIEEIYKRIIVPFYIVIVTIIASCLALKSENENNFTRYKFIIFLIGITFIVFSQAFTQYAGSLKPEKYFFIITPFITTLIFYILMQLKLKD